MNSAVAGATTISSAQRASSMWPIAASAASSHKSVRTGRAGHGLEGQRGHELLGAARHHDLHFGAVLDQPAHQVRTLVGGDAAGDAEQNLAGLRTHGRIMAAASGGSKRCDAYRYSRTGSGEVTAGRNFGANT